MAGKGSEATQFKKGQSGNPKGRPKANLTSILKEEVAKQLRAKGKSVEIDGVKVSVAQALIKKLIGKALNGDMKAMQMLFDRNDGKCVETVQQQIKLDGAVFCDKEGNVIGE